MQFSLLGFVLEEVKQQCCALNGYLSIFSTMVWTYEMRVFCLFVCLFNPMYVHVTIPFVLG